MSKDKIAVIKLGGHAMDDSRLLASFCEDIARLSHEKIKFIIVHGGGPHINALLNRLHIKSNFLNGLRVTDAETLAAVEMVLCGAVNKMITRRLLACGANAVGISGEDADLLQAKLKDPELGLVGEITGVKPGILAALLEQGYIPIVAPLALNKDFEALNVNADTAAGAIAGALKADFFILISDVPGVLDKNGNLLQKLDNEAIDALKKDGTISGGMIPKVECCQYALAKGCKEAIILNGKLEGSLGRLLRAGEQNGTVIAPN